MKTQTISSRIDENGIVRKNRKKLSDAFKSFSGKEVDVIIKQKYSRRSIPENRYYWGVVVKYWEDLIEQEWGAYLSPKEVHEVLKFHCNYRCQIIESTGEEIKVPMSTADLKTTEFEDYLERCRRKAFEYFNTVIPLPNEQLELEL